MPLVESIFQEFDLSVVLQPRLDSYEVGLGTMVKDKTKQFRVSTGASQLFSDNGDKHQLPRGELAVAQGQRATNLLRRLGLYDTRWGRDQSRVVRGRQAAT